MCRCLCRRLPTLLQQHRRGPVAGESVKDRPRVRYYTAAAGAGAGLQSLREQILRVHGDDCSTQSRLGLLSAKFFWSKIYSDINHLGFTYAINHPFHDRVDLNQPLKRMRLKDSVGRILDQFPLQLPKPSFLLLSSPVSLKRHVGKYVDSFQRFFIKKVVEKSSNT